MARYSWISVCRLWMGVRRQGVSVLWVRPDTDRVPIIAMTANAFSEDVKQSLDSGMNAHIAKPIDMEKIIRTIQEYVWNS